MNSVIDLLSREAIPLNTSMPCVHCHDSHELYYLAKGCTTYYIGRRIYQLHAGEFVFIPKGILHRTAYDSHADNERFLINFSDKIFTSELYEIKRDLCSTHIIHIPEEMISYFEGLLNQIETENSQRNNYNTITMRIYLSLLLVQLCRYRCDFQPVFSDTEQLIYDISKYIRRHFDETISLSRLSHEFSMSESHLSRLFKTHTGIGINEYLTYVRIANAEKLLKETDLPIAQIAQQCGYDDSNYFSTVFKRIKNITPQKYRKL